jgi:hypothetical protein
MISAQTRSVYARENRFALCVNAALRAQIIAALRHVSEQV